MAEPKATKEAEKKKANTKKKDGIRTLSLLSDARRD
jgi:hypothetical protein